MLTEKQAIAETKRLWGEIDKSGLSKHDFFSSGKGIKWMDENHVSHCPLCQYVEEREENCSICPIHKKYKTTCSHLGYSYGYRNEKFFKAIRDL